MGSVGDRSSDAALSVPLCTVVDPGVEASLHAQHRVDEVLRLVAEGWNDCQISRATGVNRRTILDWRHGRLPRQRPIVGSGGDRIGACPKCDGAGLDEPAYAYLLGLYLGDGCISRERRAFRLRIVQDARYAHLIGLTIDAISRVRAGYGRVGTIKKVGCVEIYASWNHWPCVFPQHGPGVKHLRKIALAPWQERIVDRYPRQLLRGLVHSDGCRVTNRVWNGRYEYPRYFFSNMSTDILQIFRDACDAIGVPHRNSRPNVISVARRDGVAALDAFIGLKA